MEDTDAKNGSTSLTALSSSKGGSVNHLARLILETEAAQLGAGESMWDRLNMERVARRLIQTARVAAAEHAMLRVQAAIRQLHGPRKSA